MLNNKNMREKSARKFVAPLMMRASAMVRTSVRTSTVFAFMASATFVATSHAQSISAKGFNNLDGHYENLYSLIEQRNSAQNTDASDTQDFLNVGNTNIASHLEPIDDATMRAVQGQALFDISQRTGSDGTQFLRMLFNAQIETNLNINKLKLGNDIDMDKVSISGGTGPDSYATIIRPFLELAIKDFDNAANKKILGLRMGSEAINGMMSVGVQDQGCIGNTNPCGDTGINKFHGYMKTTDLNIAEARIAALELQDYMDQRAAGTGNTFEYSYPQVDANGNPLLDRPQGTVTAKRYFYPAYYSAEEIDINPGATNDAQYLEHLNNNVFYSNELNQLHNSSDHNQSNLSHGYVHTNSFDLGTCLDTGLFGICTERLQGNTTADNTFDGQIYNEVLPWVIAPGFNGYGLKLQRTIPEMLLIDTPVPGIQINTVNGSISSFNVTSTFTVNDVLFETDQDGVQGDNPVTGLNDDKGEPVVVTYLSDEDGGSLLNLIGGSMNMDLLGVLKGFEAKLDLTESLKFFHKINLNDGVSLSMQSETVNWPGATVGAQKGYWLAVEGEVQVDDIILPNRIYMTPQNYREIEVALERVLFWKNVDPAINDGDLDNDRVEVTFSGVITGTPVNLGVLNIPPGSPINAFVENISLGASQQEVNNCYGGIDCF